jgi:flagella basal body P-ring formation protein FlgA
MIGLLLAWGMLPAAAGTDTPAVRIYLPRTAKVAGEALQLGQICVVLCDDAPRETRARGLAMGRAPWPQEKLLIDRRTILSRLASCGIDRQRVQFVGAAAVTVSRDEQVIRTEKLLAAAEAFLQQSVPGEQGCIYRVVRAPEDITVCGRRDLEYACELADNAAAGCVKILVRIRHDGKQVGLREVLYKRMYPVRRAVVVQTLTAGEAVSQENVEVQTSYAERPAPADWKPPYGRLATRTLLVGTILREGLTADKKPDLLIQRNQIVKMRVEGRGFSVIAKGLALQPGRPGDFIKVRNVDSQRVVVGRVAFDGAVEPLFDSGR